MTKFNSFLAETADTASFAFREYFRPLVAVAGWVKSILVHSQTAGSPEDKNGLEGAKAHPAREAGERPAP
jgi:hypothetical protein